MSNLCSTRYKCIQCKAVVHIFPRKRHGIRYSFSTLSQPLTPSKSLVTCLGTQLGPRDAQQQGSAQWFALRRNRLTTSTFSTALGFWRGLRRHELWQEKVFSLDRRSADKTDAKEWGVLNEAVAVERYKSITGHDVRSLGFAVHSDEQHGWLGASPDGILGDFPGGGILEVKCPFNKGRPETGVAWSTMPFYYMPQVQGLMEIMDREWVDLYCWTPNGSTIFRVGRDRGYWEMIHGILREFWWENVIPAREALLLGRDDEAGLYKPESTHRSTGFVIAKSFELAAQAELLCREVAGLI